MHLLFDLGGVFVDIDKQRCLDSFAQLGLDATPYVGAFEQSGVFALLEEGKISPEEFCTEVRALGCRPETTDEEIVAAWTSLILGIPAERLELLLKIRQHYPTALLSNTNPLMWAKIRDDFFAYNGHTVADFFQDIFLSFELGVCKPQAAIFEKVVEKLGVPASEILFFDDSEANCEAARRLGFQALLAPADSQWLHHFDAEGRLRS